MSFVHLHNHTQYSMLDGACKIDDIMQKCKEYNMPAVAMTDHGNMYGTIEFYKKAKDAGIKPIIGQEFYYSTTEIDDPEFRTKKNKQYHLILLVKNEIGYKNIIKLSSIAFIDGFYKKPCISKRVLMENSEGLICLSACIAGEIPQYLKHEKYEEAKEAVSEFKNNFGDDFYLELQDHEIEDEKLIMPRLIKLAEETNTPMVVTNDSHYINAEDAESHEILLAVQTKAKLSDENRFKFGSDQLYFKSEEEMKDLFPGLDCAYDNTVKIAEKVNFDLKYEDLLFPVFEVPEQFKDQSEYLRHLCYENAKIKYDEITDEIKDRIEYELGVIGKMKYEGYFLIVKDFIDAARERNVPVGPGRGSAAGSIISYLLNITTIDPLKYNLLFERFLNPDRIGMPDIDIDFCAEGRQKIIDYVIEKYGEESVTQIITYGKLGGKSVLKDVARVMGMEASDANAITKTMEDKKIGKCLKNSPEFKETMNSDRFHKDILRHSKTLEGLVRQSGIHAAGVVIGPGDLKKYVPLATTNKDGKRMVLVQYEGKWLDDLKMLKMDFLGLKTLTLIDKTVKLIKQSNNIEVDINNIHLDDEETFKLLAEAKTDGVFQLESAGMKKHLKNLKPNVFEDIIAMVALYRPGPMDYIDSFIKRKHGEEKIEYDHELVRNALEETYGITVYQEQVMQISKEMGAFTGGQADTLRKAIGKKKLDQMAKMKDLFFEGAKGNGVSEKVYTKIWEDWLKFASYAFNKSHATCYAYVAYQTAYLKTHYPVEFMAALLTLEKDPDKIPLFVNSAKRMDIEVLPPSVNRSFEEFSVVDGKVQFGLRGIKNVGTAAIKSIVENREKKGKYKDIFDFCKKVDSMAVNKAVLQSLNYSGSFDDFPGNRAELDAIIPEAIDYASNLEKEEQKGQLLLFDSFESDTTEEDNFHPEMKEMRDFDFHRKIELEKSVLGYYLSGHPLTPFKELINNFSNTSTKQFYKNKSAVPQKINIIGMLTKKRIIDGKKGEFGTLEFEDLSGKFLAAMFEDNYNEYFHDLKIGGVYWIKGKKSMTKFAISSGLLNLNISKIIPIEDLKKEFSGYIEVETDIDNLNKETGKKLIDLTNQFRGSFSINISCNTDRFNRLKFSPKDVKVFPCASFISKMKNIGFNLERIKY